MGFLFVAGLLGLSAALSIATEHIETRAKELTEGSADLSSVKAEAVPKITADHGPGTHIYNEIMDRFDNRLPITVNTTGESPDLVIMDYWRIEKMPGFVAVLYYPLVFGAAIGIWWMTCRQSNRDLMDWKLPFEASFCSMCLWSDLAIQTNAMALQRPLVYIGTLFGTCFVWKFSSTILWFLGLEERIGKYTYGICSIILALVWVSFAYERALVRSHWRTRSRTKATGQRFHTFYTDFLAHLCCFPFATMQDAVFAMDVEPLEQNTASVIDSVIDKVQRVQAPADQPVTHDA
jgi:hypothetical protein